MSRISTPPKTKSDRFSRRTPQKGACLRKPCFEIGESNRRVSGESTSSSPTGIAREGGKHLHQNRRGLEDLLGG